MTMMEFAKWNFLGKLDVRNLSTIAVMSLCHDICHLWVPCFRSYAVLHAYDASRCMNCCCAGLYHSLVFFFFAYFAFEPSNSFSSDGKVL